MRLHNLSLLAEGDSWGSGRSKKKKKSKKEVLVCRGFVGQLSTWPVPCTPESELLTHGIAAHHGQTNRVERGPFLHNHQINRLRGIPFEFNLRLRALPAKYFGIVLFWLKSTYLLWTICSAHVFWSQLYIFKAVANKVNPNGKKKYCFYIDF